MLNCGYMYEHEHDCYSEPYKAVCCFFFFSSGWKQTGVSLSHTAEICCLYMTQLAHCILLLIFSLHYTAT